MRGRRFIRNTLVLTGVSTAMRLTGLAFQVWLTERAGASGVGLFLLAASVGAFAATFAISGSRFTVTRLVSEELGRENGRGALAAVGQCLLYAAVFGLMATALLFSGAGFIGERLIGDGRTVLSLRLLSLDMPFLAMGAVFYGYFTARGQVFRMAAAQGVEQGVKIAVTALLLRAVPLGDAEQTCAAVVCGSISGETAGFLLSLVLFLRDRSYLRGFGGRPRGMLGRILAIAPPLAVSAYVRTALTAVCSMLVPRGLRAYGAAPEAALADYGVIHGMALPIAAFPAALFVAMAEMLVPELTRAQVRGDADRIRRIVARLLSACLVFSSAAALLLVLLADKLGETFYAAPDVGRYIRALAFLMPVTCLDTVTDGMLRGLGEQLYAMRVNIADSVLSLALITLLLPRFGVRGYVFLLYFTSAFNFALSLRRLWRRVYPDKRPLFLRKSEKIH